MSTPTNNLILWQSAIISNALCIGSGSGPGRPKRYPYEIAAGHDAHTLTVRIELPFSMTREQLQSKLGTACTKAGVNSKDEWATLSRPKTIKVIEASKACDPLYKTFFVTLAPPPLEPWTKYFTLDPYDPELKKDI